MLTSTIYRLALLVTILFDFLTKSNAAIEIQLQRVEQIGGEHLVDTSLTRVRKFNRTTFALNGTAVLLQDLDETYEVNMKAAYSRLGNNQWNEYPMKLSQKKACQAMVDEYRQYQHVFINSSNLPYISPNATKFCPIPRGTYWIRDLAPEASWIPPVVPAGYWRMTVELRRKGEVVGVLRSYSRLLKGFF